MHLRDRYIYHMYTYIFTYMLSLGTPHQAPPSSLQKQKKETCAYIYISSYIFVKCFFLHPGWKKASALSPHNQGAHRSKEMENWHTRLKSAKSGKGGSPGADDTKVTARSGTWASWMDTIRFPNNRSYSKNPVNSFEF